MKGKHPLRSSPQNSSTEGPRIPSSAAILESIQIGIVVLSQKRPDEDGFRIAGVNSAAAKLIGSTTRALLGKPLSDLPENLATLFLKRYLEAVGSETPVNLGEVELVSADDRGCTGYYSVSFFSLPGGRMCIAIEDVTRQKRAETALRESDYRQRAWFERNSVPMWVFDREDLSLLAVNEAAIRTYGHLRDEFPCPANMDIRSSEGVPHFFELIRARDAGLKEISYSRYKKKDGSLADVEICTRWTSWGGKPAEIVQVRDVSELKPSWSGETDQTAYLNALVTNNPVSVVGLDSEGLVRMCNPAFEKFFMVRESDIIGASVCDVITPPECWPEATAIGNRVSNGQTVHAITQRRRTDGTVVDVQFCAVPLIVNGRLLGAYHFYQDITERKRAEQTIRRKDEALRELTGRFVEFQDEERRRMARELHDSAGQCLSAVSMKIGVASRLIGFDDARSREAMSEALDMAKDCSRMIRTFSFLLRPPVLDAAGLANALKWYAEGFSERSGIRIDLDIAPELGQIARESETALFRTVQEALANIHLHSKSPSAKIRIVRTSDKVLLEVEDQGHGIPPEILEGSGADHSRLGVGITGMKERVAQLGGSFEIKSQGHGTIIRALFPVLMEAA